MEDTWNFETNNFLKSCYEGNLDQVKKYIETDFKNPYVVDTRGRTGLIYAIWGNNVEIVRYLISGAPEIHLILTLNKTSVLDILSVCGTPEMRAMFINSNDMKATMT